MNTYILLLNLTAYSQSDKNTIIRKLETYSFEDRKELNDFLQGFKHDYTDYYPYYIMYKDAVFNELNKGMPFKNYLYNQTEAKKPFDLNEVFNIYLFQDIKYK